MWGRIAQSETRRYYARLLRPDILERKWIGEDSIPKYNLSPGRPALLLHMLDGKLRSDYLTWGYRWPNEAAAKREPAREEVEPEHCQAHHRYHLSAIRLAE
jgi:hypothetical protein